MEPLSLAALSAGAGSITQFLRQASKDRHDITMQIMGKANSIANDAQKRGSAFGRRFAMVTVLTVGFLGLLYAAHAKIPVSQIIEGRPILDLFGILKLGGGPKVITAEGLVLPPYVTDSIIAIIFFLFGSGAAKR